MSIVRMRGAIPPLPIYLSSSPSPLPSSAVILSTMPSTYRDADKSLARPGRKQATATEDFDVHVSYL